MHVLRGGVGSVRSVGSVDTTKMTLLRYLKLTDDPKCSVILHTTTDNCLAAPNDEGHESVSRKCGPYLPYSSGIRAKIGNYDSHHDVPAALHFFLELFT